MKCEPCVKECKDRVGCAHRKTQTMRPTTNSGCMSRMTNTGATAHVMVLTGGMYRCNKGHKVEAHPADAMRAAGQEPML